MTAPRKPRRIDATLTITPALVDDDANRYWLELRKGSARRQLGTMSAARARRTVDEVRAEMTGLEIPLYVLDTTGELGL